MASKALVQLEPETVRLYAFTIEATTNELEKGLAQGVVPTISGRPVGDIIRDLAASLRQGADKAEGDFKSKISTRSERQARRAERKGGNGKHEFGNEDFPGAEAFGLSGVNVGAGGGQTPPGQPPVNTAEMVPGTSEFSTLPPAAGGNIAEKSFEDDSL